MNARASFNDDQGFLGVEDLDGFRTQMSRCWGVGQLSSWVQVGHGIDLPAVEHATNSHGFRDHEIIMDPDICYYGCSFTWGDGVHVDDRWTSVLDRMMGFRSNNFAVGGISAEGITDMFMVTSKLMPIPRAVVLWPDWFRAWMPFVLDDGYRHWGLFPRRSDMPIVDPAYDQRVMRAFESYNQLPTEHFINIFRDCLATVRTVAELNGIQLWMSTWCDFEQQRRDIQNSRCCLIPWFDNDGLAIDRMHAGPAAHARFAADAAAEIRKYA